jgi:cytochrome b
MQPSAGVTDHAFIPHAFLRFIVLHPALHTKAGVPENARFANFVRGPLTVFDYLTELIRFSSKRYLGHSPAGGAMIVVLLIMISATAITGTANLAADERTGPLAGFIAKVERPPRVPGQRRPPLVMKQVHEAVANLTLAFVVFHLLGVGLASLVHRENLINAMITGRKRRSKVGRETPTIVGLRPINTGEASLAGNTARREAFYRLGVRP